MLSGTEYFLKVLEAQRRNYEEAPGDEVQRAYYYGLRQAADLLADALEDPEGFRARLDTFPRDIGRQA